MDEVVGFPRPKIAQSSMKKHAADTATIGARAPRPPPPSTDATIVSIDLASSSSSASDSPPPFQQVIVDHGLLRKPLAQHTNPDSGLGLGLGMSSGQSPAVADRGRDGPGPAVVDHGLLRKVEAATVRIQPLPVADDNSLASSSARRRSTSSSVRAPHGLLKKFSPVAIDAAVRFEPASPSPSDSLTQPEPEPVESGTLRASARDSSPYIRGGNLPALAGNNNTIGPGPKHGGVLDVDEPKGVRICVLGVCGRVLYLEAYKDFVDLLLNFLTMRTGAVIKLIRQVDLPLEDDGILNVYDSLSKLDRSMLTVDKDVLLDPVQKLNLTKELLALDSFEAQCCNAECPKYMAGSRLVCRGCTLSNHFSCSICNAYFRDNVHATTCYAPWRPWGSHVSAAPVLTRYTVVKSMGALPAAAAASMRTRAARDGFVKNGVPFMITNELTLTPLTTRSIAKFLKTLNDQDGETESPDCHELMIGKTEVVLLLGAAMTSLTPLTDVFAKMCNSENKISGSSTFSEGLPSLSGGQFPQRTDNKQVATETGSRLPSMAKPLVDLMTYVRPLASGFADALQQGTAAAVHGVSTEAQHREVELEGAALDQESLNAVEDKSPAAARRKKTRAPSSSSPVATTQAVDREIPNAAEDSDPAAAAMERTSVSVATMTRELTGSRTGLSLSHLRIQGPAAAFAPLDPVESTPPPEIQQKQEDDLHLPAAADDKPAQLTIRRMSSGIVPPQSIFLQPNASEGSPSPSSSSPSGSTTPRRGFFKKFFKSKVVQSPKISSPPSPPVTPPFPVTSTPPALAAEGSISPYNKGNELPPSASDDQQPSAADNDQPQPSPPPATSTPGPKKRRGWFKFFAPKLAAPLPKPSQLPTTKTPDLPQSPLPDSADTLAEDDEEFPASVTSRKFDSVESANGEAVDDGDEEEEDAAAIVRESPAENAELESEFELKSANHKSPSVVRRAREIHPSVDFSFEHGAFK